MSIRSSFLISDGSDLLGPANSILFTLSPVVAHRGGGGGFGICLLPPPPPQKKEAFAPIAPPPQKKMGRVKYLVSYMVLIFCPQ